MKIRSIMCFEHDQIQRIIVFMFFVLLSSVSYGQTDVVECTSGVVDTDAEDGILVDSECGELNIAVGTVSGSIEVKGSGTLTIDANITLVTGSIVVESGGNLTINGDIGNINGSITNDGALTITGSITAEGKLEVKGGGSTTLDGGSFTSTGDGVVIESGAVVNLENGSSIDADGGVENSGTINADATGNSIEGGVTGGGTIDTDLGNCTASCTDAPLPITLASFGGVSTLNSISLNWTTQSEENFDYFDIGRSLDGNNYESIGIVKGNGNSKTRIDYSFEDQVPMFGLVYYRLTAIDLDGSFEIFCAISVNHIPVELEVNIYPNPSNGSGFNINFGLPTEAKTKFITIFDMFGSKAIEMQLSDHNTHIDSWLIKGVYIAKIQIDNYTLTKRIVVN